MISGVIPSLSPEMSLLIAAARLHLDDDGRKYLSEYFNGQPDLTRLVACSIQLKAAPLLYTHIMRNGLNESIPQFILNMLKTEYRRESIKNLRIFGQFKDILDMAARSNIPIIPLKGIYLARSVYGDIGLRPMSDIDILCKKRDIPALQDLLINSGYHQESLYRSSLHEKLALHGSHHLPPFIKPQGYGLEVHTHLFSDTACAPQDMDSIWGRAVPVTHDGGQFHVLSPDDQLLHLTYHLFIHIRGYRTVPLYWFCDIDAWIRKNHDEIDWNHFYAMLESLGITTKAGSVLGLVMKHWQTPIPEAATRLFEGSFDDIVIRDVFQFRKRNYAQICAQEIKRQFRTLGWKEGLYLLLGYLFPREDFLVHEYKIKDHRSVLPYRLLHPLTIARRVIAGISSHGHALRR